MAGGEGAAKDVRLAAQEGPTLGRDVLDVAAAHEEKGPGPQGLAARHRPVSRGGGQKAQLPGIHRSPDIGTQTLDRDAPEIGPEGVEVEPRLDGAALGGEDWVVDRVVDPRQVEPQLLPVLEVEEAEGPRLVGLASEAEVGAPEGAHESQRPVAA